MRIVSCLRLSLFLMGILALLEVPAQARPDASGTAMKVRTVQTADAIVIVAENEAAPARPHPQAEARPQSGAGIGAGPRLVVARPVTWPEPRASPLI